jgi:hypothetical protein
MKRPLIILLAAVFYPLKQFKSKKVTASIVRSRVKISTKLNLQAIPLLLLSYSFLLNVNLYSYSIQLAVYGDR